MAYMQDSSDDKVMALLAAHGDTPHTAAAPSLPPSDVMDKLITLLQTCGEGVDDLGPDILQSEARACDMAAAGDHGWVEAMETAERQRGGADGENTFGRVRVAPGADTGQQDEAIDSMGVGADDEDAFAAEIAAVGTHLQQICAQCGESFTEQRYACQKSPGRESHKTEKETR